MCRLAAFVLISLFFNQPILANQESEVNDVELHNLRWDWHSIDPETGQFVPYFQNSETTTIHFEIGLNRYRSAYLKFNLPTNTFCWIEQQLIFKSDDIRPLYLSIDSLRDVYSMSKLSITLYHENLEENLISTTVVNRNQSFQQKQDQEPELRYDLKQTDLFLIISIIVLLLIATFRTAHYRLFREYFSISKALQQRQNFDLITAYSPLAWPNIGFLIFYAILVGCSAINIGLYHIDESFTLPFGMSWQNSLLLGVKLIVLCFVFMLLKLVLISASSALFQINKVRLIHFFAYFRHSLIIAIGLFIFSLVNGIFEGSMVSGGWSLIQVLVVFVWSGRVIQIFFVLNKIYTFRKLHLFSYLCSTELIPLLLFLKVFLK